MPRLEFIDEPALSFNHEQRMLDPRDGLSLFGPLDMAKPEGIRWAAIGPGQAVARMKRWVDRIQAPVTGGKNPVARPVFPGFEAAFATHWRPTPVLEVVLPEDRLRQHAYCSDRHQRVYRTVDMYAARIKEALRTEDVRPDVWCVIVPEYVYQNCRPRSNVDPELRVQPGIWMSKKEAEKLEAQPSLFDEANEFAEQYMFHPDFHHQLKARLLHEQAPIQIVREITIAHREFLDSRGNQIYSLEDQESAIAWNLCTAFFYKAGGRPWKLAGGRYGVCYIGLVFKQDHRSSDPRTACCAAQMFLDSGDGVVFKGAVGPWYRGKRGLFHLDRPSATQVVRICLEAYAARNAGQQPRELFLHGQIAFDDEEWAGFCEAVTSATKLVGVRIRDVSSLKLFRLHDHPVLRGIAYLANPRLGFLWTRGLVPRLRTYIGREVPNPLLVDVCRGQADLATVMADILALTKLNYNACNYGDGWPVTLRFARAVGEILTAGPARSLQVPPLPFKFYI